MLRSLFVLVLGVALFAMPRPSAAQEVVAFDDPAWVIEGEGATIERYLDRQALRLRTGIARLPEVEFENGSIEFEFATSGRRSFVGIRFRMESDRDCEYIYFRPHNAGKWDAMQYTPIDHGQTSWQLFSGEGYGAAVAIPEESWIHVRVEVAGSRAEVFVDRSASPVLTVTDLKRGRSRGGVALFSLYPGGRSDDHVPTAFSGFTIVPRDVDASYNRRTPPPAGSGLIGSWSVHPPFPTPEEPLMEVPRDGIDPLQWFRVDSETSGIVNFATVANLPRGGGTILARVFIRSDRRQTKKLNFGFSDRAVLFLNGAPLFSGDTTYRSRSPRYLGVMTVDHEAVYLLLEEGDNELLFAVSEAFGGWGLIARLEDRAGIELRAEPPEGTVPIRRSAGPLRSGAAKEGW
jgi:hypothetical protein